MNKQFFTYVLLLCRVAAIASRNKGCCIFCTGISSPKNALPHASSTSSSSRAFGRRVSLLCFAVGEFLARLAFLIWSARFLFWSVTALVVLFSTTSAENIAFTSTGAAVQTRATIPHRSAGSPDKCIRARRLGKIFPPSRTLQNMHSQKYLVFPCIVSSITPSAPPKYSHSGPLSRGMVAAHFSSGFFFCTHRVVFNFKKIQLFDWLFSGRLVLIG